MRDEIVNFISILPELFSDDLDRKTLWERIGNGLMISIAKSGGDFEAFINGCLSYIKADHGKVAANENFASWVSVAFTRPNEWRVQFMRFIERKNFLVVLKARAQWNINKGNK